MNIQINEVVPSPRSSLEMFRQKSKTLLLDSYRQLPEPYGYVAQKQYLSRHESHRAADSIPWIIADLVGIDPSKGLDDLAGGWLLVNSYTLFTDDVLDEPALRSDPLLPVAAGLCLQEGMGKLQELVPPEQLSSEISRCFRSIAAGVAVELGRSVVPDRTQQHKRMATVTLWYNLLTHVFAEAKETRPLQDLIEQFANALQLVDDIADWEDDFLGGRMTAPVHQTMIRAPHLHLDPTVEGSADLFLLAMVGTSTLGDLLDYIALELESAIQCLDGSGDSTLMDFLSVQSDLVGRTRWRIRPLEERLIGESFFSELNQTDLLMVLEEDRPLHEHLQELRHFVLPLLASG